MKIPKIATALSQIDEDLLTAANAKPQKRKHPARFWIPVAACLCLLLAVSVSVSVHFFSKDKEGSSGVENPVQSDSRYKNVVIANSAIVWPWEYKTLPEQYTSITYGGRTYDNRGRSVDTALLGQSLGIAEARGFDTYTDREYLQTFSVYAINGVSTRYLIAVKMEDAYYVFDAHQAKEPSTLGDMIDAYNLTHTLPLTNFSVEDGNEKSFALTSDTTLWEILSGCREAELIEDDSFFYHHKQSISFTVTSQELGVYKQVFLITEDGYLWTNVCDYAKIFFIGTDASEQIKAYTIQNAKAVAPEPYEYTIAGQITQIGEDYFLLDETPVCTDPADGKIYQISCASVSIQRRLKFEGIGVGDIVVVKYDGVIIDGIYVEGAYDMNEGKLHNGDVVVPG